MMGTCHDGRHGLHAPVHDRWARESRSGSRRAEGELGGRDVGGARQAVGLRSYRAITAAIRGGASGEPRQRMNVAVDGMTLAEDPTRSSPAGSA